MRKQESEALLGTFCEMALIPSRSLKAFSFPSVRFVVADLTLFQILPGGILLGKERFFKGFFTTDSFEFSN